MELVENALVNKRWTMVRAQARAIIFMSKFQVYKFVLHPAQVSDPEKMSRLAARNQQALVNGHRSKCSALNRVNGTITAHIADTAKSMQTAVANRTKSEQHTHDAEKKTASVEKMAANKAAAHAHILQLEQHKEAGGAVNKNGDGHLHHYTLEAQETREAIRHLPHVEDILTHWWHACHAHFDDGDQTLSKDEYRVFYDRLVSAFSEHEQDGDVDIDDPEVLEAAFEEDWERDSHGDGNIDNRGGRPSWQRLSRTPHELRHLASGLESESPFLRGEASCCPDFKRLKLTGTCVTIPDIIVETCAVSRDRIVFHRHGAQRGQRRWRPPL